MAKVELNLGKCKAHLVDGIGNLDASIKANDQITLAQRIKYEAAIVQMKLAYKLLKDVKCEQPDMTIEIPAKSTRTRARRTSRPKRR